MRKTGGRVGPFGPEVLPLPLERAFQRPVPITGTGAFSRRAEVFTDRWREVTWSR